jgi:trimeric autotransporter adhesin
MNPIFTYPRPSAVPLVGVCTHSHRWNDVTNVISDDQQFRLIKDCGARIVRWGIQWADVETVAGRYDFTKYLNLFNLLKGAGIKSVILLGHGNPLYTPSWSSPPLTPQAIAAFAAFAVAAVKQFGCANAYYEITNEPNQPNGWNATVDPVAYGALLGPVVKAMKTYHPEVSVISGGLGVNDPNNFIKTALAAVDKTLLAGVGYHPYTNGDGGLSDPAMRPEGVLDRFRACRQAVGAGCPPICNTEQGYYLTTCNGATLADKLARQAQFAARFVLNALYIGSPFSIWYDLIDDGLDMTEMEFGLGLYDYNFDIKPAGVAFKSTVALLNNCLSASTYKDGDLYQAVFNMPDVPKTVVWSSYGQVSYPLTVDEKKLPTIIN